MIQRIPAVAFLGFVVILASAGPARVAEPPKPRKVVLIAGPLDKGHPRGTHEYEKVVLLLKHCLDHSPDGKLVSTEVYFGWPADGHTLDRADAIVLVCSGANKNEPDHPLFVGNHLAVIETQMKRGCGLALIHWGVFVPKDKAGEKFLDWVGGYFDYESGPKPKGWYSKIKFANTEVVPARDHPIGRGLKPFKINDEFYYDIRFRERDPRMVPVLSTAIPGEVGEKVVAWTVDRKDGGRGFGFTGGHFFSNYSDDSFRRFVLNAIVWIAKAEVPADGMRSTVPTEEELDKMAPPRPVTLEKGRFGKALNARATPVHFDGEDRYRRTPLTVECWAKLASKKEPNILVGCDPRESGQHWEIGSAAESGVFSAIIPGTDIGEIKSNVDICDAKWHHVAMTSDGKTVRLLVDGKLAKEQAINPKERMKPQPGPLTIGQTWTARQRFGCDGLIDDVRISRGIRSFDGVPSSAAILDPETLGLWNFDKPIGLLTGDPLWTPPPPTSATAADWEKMSDKDWVDGRLRAMDTGPTFNATFDYPTWKGKEKVYKGTAIRIGDHGEAAVLFDRNQLRMACGWTDGYLHQTDRRFGLTNTPTPAGEVMFATDPGLGWANPDGKWESKYAATGPLPREWGFLEGIYAHGNRTILAYWIGDTYILDSPWVESQHGVTAITRTLNVGPSKQDLKLLVCTLPSKEAGTRIVQCRNGVDGVLALHNGLGTFIGVPKTGRSVTIQDGNRVVLTLKPSGLTRRIKLFMFRGVDNRFLERTIAAPVLDSPAAEDLRVLMKPGPARWPQTIVTHGKIGKSDGPFAVDTLTLPFDNPYKALMFVSGLDFLPNGDLAICTVHGDVWIAKGLDAKLDHLTWKRFATGLYQPLGLKVVDGKIIVLERGQLTRLHDGGNGEANFYECLSDDWHTGAGEHSFDTCLETDPAGNFYFFKTGDPDTPTGGCLLRVGKNGGKAEIYSTGFRHPIGLGISPAGFITGADQEGNWMPMTRIDAYQKGGFYGDMRTHHRATPPKIYDPPLLWLPKEADNSAGGQVWVPEGKWGPLSKQMLHLSYGQCKLYLLMPQKVGDTMQAGAVDLGLFFDSGVMRGRFGPDGNLYVCGLRGWQTAGVQDGCVQRVRWTGKPLTVPVDFAVHANGVRLTFAEPLDRKSAENVKAYRVEQCNYRWSADYGSKHWSVADPKKEGNDPVAVESATLSADGKSVFLRIKDVKPVMQMMIAYELQTAVGAKASGTVYNTIHKTAPAQ